MVSQIEDSPLDTVTADIEIIPFEADYTLEVKSLVLTIMELEFSGIVQNFPMEDIDNIPESYGGRRERFFIAVQDRKVIGTIGVKEDDEYTALLRRVFVSPELRGRGVGTALMQKAVRFCQREGYSTVRFQGNTVMKSAYSLCKKMGFDEDDLIRGGSFQMFIMTKHLKNGNGCSCD